MTETSLDAVRVVLYEPQNPINIGAVVRAMKNMGARSLRLVRPVESHAIVQHALESLVQPREEAMAA